MAAPIMNRKDVSTQSEEAIWIAFKAGSRVAYATIYQQHFFTLLDYGRKINPESELVKDAIQDLFVELWQQREKLAETTSVRYYLLQALKYKLYREGKATALPVEPVMIEASAEERWIQQETSAQQQQKIYYAMEKVLSPRQREAIQLKYLQQMDNDQVAQTMHISREAVYNLISKALNLLRQHAHMIWLACYVCIKELFFR